MDRQDQRKRAFSQAFQHMNQPRPSDNSQPAKRVLSYPLASTYLYHQDSDQENEVLLDLDCTPAFDQIPGTQIRRPLLADLQYVESTFYNYASLQHELYGNGPGPELKTDAGCISPPVVRNQRSGDPLLHEYSLSTPLIVRGQSMFGPSPYVRPESSPSLDHIVDSYAQSEGSPMSDVTTTVGPLTPGALNFSDLSLNSQGFSLPPSPLRVGGQGDCTTVRVVPTSSFARHFPEINPNEVIVLFDKGKEVRKVDKYPLCSASRFFAQALDGPFLDQNLTRCIRLRNDFPYVITTMLHFIKTGHYLIDQRAFANFPLLTTLDFHIHAYLVGTKYGVAALQDCAINAYLKTAEHEIKSGLLALAGGQLSDIQVAVHGSSVMVPADGHDGGELMMMPIERFLNSLVLLWKNTESRYDAMRKMVLELIKRDLSKLLQVPFFVTLMQEMVEFGDDVVASLGEDGFEVKAFQVDAGAKQGQTIRFGV